MKKADDLITKLKKYFANRNDIAFAFLFGSYAAGRANRHSDIDVAVYFYPGVRHPVPYEEETYYDGEDQVWADLDQLLGKEVELLVLNRASAAVCGSAARGIILSVKDWPLYFDFVETISREAEDFMYMRIKDFRQRLGSAAAL
ncbi:MAG: nucleotidyltransferase domain-containing protein [Candidatus Aminicenantes bacterium]|nr:nucleotidyltransferase domain-containing protein [Candidatus Aminicenantes bacterium]